MPVLDNRARRPSRNPPVLRHGSNPVPVAAVRRCFMHVGERIPRGEGAVATEHRRVEAPVGGELELVVSRPADGGPGEGRQRPGSSALRPQEVWSRDTTPPGCKRREREHGRGCGHSDPDEFGLRSHYRSQPRRSRVLATTHRGLARAGPSGDGLCRVPRAGCPQVMPPEGPGLLAQGWVEPTVQNAEDARMGFLRGLFARSGERLSFGRGPDAALVGARSWLFLAVPGLFLFSLAFLSYHLFDFKIFWEAGRHLLNGQRIYPSRAALDQETRSYFIYPPVVAFSFVPFALLPFALAGALYWLFAILATVLALRVLGVTYKRCYFVLLYCIHLLQG